MWRRLKVLGFSAWTLAFAAALALPVPADAADHPVNSESDLRTAIATATDGDTITFHVDLTLTQDLPAIQTNVTLLGNGQSPRWRAQVLGTLRGEVRRRSRTHPWP